MRCRPRPCCSECGAANAPADSSAASAAPRWPRKRWPTCGDTAPQAERRLVSVLFADLVGLHDALREHATPRTSRELLSRYFETARTVIERYGGTVEKFIGDAVMAVWGAPVAHEDDAERAVRAALDLVDAVAALGTRSAHRRCAPAPACSPARRR